MTFFSLQFMFFLVIVFVLYYIIPRKYRYVLLAFSGIVFYASHGSRFLYILFGVTLISYLAAYIISRGIAKRAVLIFSVILLGGLWFVFRPGGVSGGIAFFSGAAVGISFYTLTAIGYVADVYNKKTEYESNILKYFLFISFFPTVISGPIERSDNLLCQIGKGSDFSYDKTKRGLMKILYGLFLKCLIADRMALIVNGILKDYGDKTGSAILIGVILYGLQLYADFSGYTCIAVGLSMLFGFNVPENFAQPFFAASIREFWGRWHISLSSWLRDYIYIPLGGNRKGKLRKYVNLLITFLVSGFWHGYGLQYIVWGLLHGLFQIGSTVMAPLNKKMTKKLNIRCECFGFRLLQVLVTLVLFYIAFIFFCAPSLGDAVRMIEIMFTDFKLGKTLVGWLYAETTDFERFFILAGEVLIWFFVDLAHENKISINKWMESQNKAFRWMIYLSACLMLIVGILYNYGADAGTFIYAGF